ncbi:MAG TPA: hypothetical protein VGO35_09230 [Gammaproteobacteria bacterium]|jgi:uncharacterized membrane protein YagU involved in acid resistance|nr:hypothetical protein [Gammaproteobacteria bacterium]
MNIGKYPVVTAILLGGLIGGTIDIGSASLISGFNPIVIMHAIASGLIGKASFSGGAATAVLGLVLQWAMAILIAAIYMGVTAKLPAMRKRWQTTGVIAGVIIYFVMTYLVVPLSAAPFRPEFSIQGFVASFKLAGFLENLLAMILFGLIIGFFARKVPASAKG